MKKKWSAWGVALVCAAAQAQVQCKMPNGRWIVRQLSEVCPAGASQARTMDSQSAPLRLPDAATTLQQAPKIAARPALRSDRQKMPFQACVGLLTQTVLSVGGSNTRVIVSAPDMRMIRVCTNDGSVLMTCSRADETMVSTASPSRCN